MLLPSRARCNFRLQLPAPTSAPNEIDSNPSLEHVSEIISAGNSINFLLLFFGERRDLAALLNKNNASDVAHIQ